MNRLQCDICAGRGWVLRGTLGTTWPETCGLCAGQTTLSFYRLAKLLNVHRGTLQRVAQGRSTAANALSVFCRLTLLLEKWQPAETAVAA